jgi:murein DD-endopeptidase MepM/ murein hydrolase activator NlpD
MSILKALSPHSVSPVLGPHFSASDFAPVNLRADHPACSDGRWGQQHHIDAHIQQILSENQAKVGIGGYLEKRCLYRLSPHFNAGDTDRCIHLGIDLWAPAFTPVYAPIEGRVHSFAYNNQPLDYGYTIILEHQLNHQPFYTLYGHLSASSTSSIQVGQQISKGEQFAFFGPLEENGGWVPHLHFQCITDLLGKQGDFPGVCTEEDQSFYANICPDPSILVGIDR